MQEVIDYLHRLEQKIDALHRQSAAAQCGLSEEKGRTYLFIEKHATGELWSSHNEAKVLAPNSATWVQGFIEKIEVNMTTGQNGKFRLHLGDRMGRTWVIDSSPISAFTRNFCKTLLELTSVKGMLRVKPDPGQNFRDKNAEKNSVFAKVYYQGEDGVFKSLFSEREHENPLEDAIAHINGLLGGQTPAARPVAPVPPPIPAPAAAPAAKLAEGSPFEVVGDAWDRLWYVAQAVGLNDEAKARKRIEAIASEIGVPFNDGKLTSTQVGLIRDSILTRWATAKTKTKPEVWKGYQVAAVFCDAMIKIQPPLIVSQARDEEVVKAWVKLVGDRLHSFQ